MRRVVRRAGGGGATARVWPALGALVVGACATTGSLAPPPLPAPAQAPPVKLRPAGAVRVARLDAPPGVFAAAFVVRGGALDDPLPGLGALLADAALLGTTEDPSREEVPAVRALALGGELRAVANGRVVGWWIRGPARQAPALTRLLLDVGLAASLPATRVSGLVAQRRTQAREAGPDGAAVMTAAAVAAGVATGLGAPLALAATDAGLRGWNREVLARFYRHLVRPERAALVLAGPAGGPADAAAERAEAERAEAEARARLSAWRMPNDGQERGSRGAARAAARAAAKTAARTAAKTAAKTASPCGAPARSAHVVLSPEPEDGKRLLAFIAYRAPGPGDPRRAPFETAMNALGAEATGTLAAALGDARAARRPVALLDLGGPGVGRAVLLVRVGGRARAVLADLWKILEAGEEVAAATDPTSASRRWGDAQRQAAAERLRGATDPATAVVEVAARLLYGVTTARGQGAGGAAPGEDAAAAARGLLGRSGATVVGVGPPALGDVLKHLGPLTVWSADGRRKGGEVPPRCP